MWRSIPNECCTRRRKRLNLRIPFTLTLEDKDPMKNLRSAATAALVIMLFSAALAQKSAQHLLGADDLKKVVPSEFFFRGQKAPTQLRNSAGFQTADGKVAFAALVDVSGYSTSVQQKYQGMFVTEIKLNIGGSDLAPGAYGFGFTDKFVVMNIASDDVLTVPYQADADLKRPVPLNITEDGAGYRLFAGRKWVAIKPK
jgi:hypothetical protein